MQDKQVIRRNIRRNPEVIAVARSASGTPAMQALIFVSGIAAAFYSLALSGLL